MKLCVALDLPTDEQNLNIIRQLTDFKELWLKVGLSSFIRSGHAFLKHIRDIHPQANIFLDLKLYDIPHTMQEATKSIIDLGIDLFTIHASSGAESMHIVANELKKIKNPPLVFAVSILTSFDEKGFQDIYGQDNIANKTKHMALMAKACGIDGMVCSILESPTVKQMGLLTLTPGIRLCSQTHDQKRVGSIDDALHAQSDFIVMGRPIYNSQNPKQIVSNIYEILSKKESYD